MEAPVSADPTTRLAPEAFAERAQIIEREIGRVIVGQRELVRQTITGLLANSHVLLEGVPGLGKTMLVRTIADVIDCTFNRIQFTPDLMPADITGTNILIEEEGHRIFRFQPGPIFANLVLADEINRATPKTQSSLLEAMQEHQVTVARQRYPLDPPFFVLATQNPLEQAGTYPLPEAQLDRFLLHIRVDYPTEQEERDILAQTTGSHVGQVPRVMDGEEVLALQARVREVHLGEDLLVWINRLVRASRPAEGGPDDVRKYVKWGAGPRAGQSLVLACKARALLHGRLAATREDIVALAAPVMRHRLLLSFAAEAEQKTADDVIAALLHTVPPPTA